MLIYLASQSIPPLFLWGAGTAGGGVSIAVLNFRNTLLDGA